MDELPTQASGVLDAAREEMSPSDAQKARVRMAVFAATAGAVAGTSATAYAAGTARFASWVATGTKWLAAVGVVVAAGTTAVQVARPAPTVHRAQPRAASSVTATPTASRPAAASASAPSALPVATDAPTSMPLMAAQDATPQGLRVRHAKRNDAKVEPEGAGSTTAPEPDHALAARATASEDEIVLMKRAAGALRAGQGGEALSLLSEHAARFPQGMLAQERDGLRVLALCASGDAEHARREAERFLQRAPQSPLAARIRKGCQAEP